MINEKTTHITPNQQMKPKKQISISHDDTLYISMLPTYKDSYTLNKNKPNIVFNESITECL